MYLYAEEKLKKDLEEQNKLKEPYEKELNEVCEKLGFIDSYNNCDDKQFSHCIRAIVILLIGGISIGISTFGLLKNINLEFNLLLMVMDLIGLIVLVKSSFYIKSAYANGKEKRKLKRKGVKEFEKAKDKLMDRSLELEKEIATIQNKIDKIVKILEHISFFKETINDSFYLADSKEEYDAKISLENNESYEMTSENEEDSIRELKLEKKE